MWQSWNRNLRWLGVCLASGLSLPAASRATAEEQLFDLQLAVPLVSPTTAPYYFQDETIFTPYLINWDDAEGGEEADEAARSEYWVGVQLSDLPDLAKSQLNLEYGLATLAVMPDSPALKAGVELHDILLRVNDRPLREPIELVRAVNESKEQVIKLTLMRRGKEQTIEITPSKRPKTPGDNQKVARVAVLQDGEHGHELAQLEKALQALDKAAKSDSRLGMWFVRPPILAQKEVRVAMKAMELPDNVSITINKTGTQPAQVIVTRGNERWETTDDKLDVIPEDLRTAISHMVGRGHAMAFQAHVLPRTGVAGIGGVQGLHGVAAVPGIVAAPGLPGLPIKPTMPDRRVEQRIMVAPRGVEPGDAAMNGKLDLILEKLKRLELQVEQLQPKK